MMEITLGKDKGRNETRQAPRGWEGSHRPPRILRLPHGTAFRAHHLWAKSSRPETLNPPLGSIKEECIAVR